MCYTMGMRNSANLPAPVVFLSPAIVAEMRNHALECEGSYFEDAEEIEEMSNLHIIRGVARDYAGTMSDFIRAVTPL